MSHDGHELLICGTCGTTIRACQCADTAPVKARAGRCDRCRGRSIIETAALRLGNGLRTLPRATTPTDGQMVMEAVCGLMASEVGRILQDSLKAEGIHREIGFMLVTFDIGDPGGTMAYASNCDRADVLTLLDELRGKVSASMPALSTKRSS